MSLSRLVGIPSMSIIRFAGSPLGFEMIGWMRVSVSLSLCDATNDSFVCEEKCVFVSVYVAEVFFISRCCSSQSKNWQSFSYLGTENYSLLLDLVYRRTPTVLYRFGCLRSR